MSDRWRGESTTHLVSQSDAASGNAIPSGTGNVTIPGLSITFTVRATTEKWAVDLTADVTMGGTAGIVNIVELLVDGAPETSQLIGGNIANVRATVHQQFLLTGLSIGSHTLTARTRNNAAGNAQVSSGNTTMRLTPAP